MIERIEHDGKTLALVLRNAVEIPEGVNFFTENESPFQVGLLRHRAGARIRPHAHKVQQRIIESTQEVLIINRGRVLAEFYDDQGSKIKETILGPGDTILLMSGGHGFRMLEDSRIVEIKQGPYLGQDADKEKLKPETEKGEQEEQKGE